MSSPSSVSTLLCLSVEHKNGEMATIEPQINHQLVRKRPSQITKEISKGASEFGAAKPHEKRRAVNDLIKKLKENEISIISQYLEKLQAILKNAVQSTISFKKFWDNDAQNNQSVDTAFDSLMRVMGFNSHENHYFSNDVEEITKEVAATVGLVQILQQYYAPFALENIKPKLVHCFETDEIAKKAYTVLKLKNLDDLLEDMSISISENSLNLTKGPVKLTGEFNMIYPQSNQGDQMSDFINKITNNIRKGENTMLLSIGATGSGKSETFFRSAVNKKEKGERPDEALVLQMLEKLLDQEAQPNKESSVLSFECKYLQVFNENLFDLLKKEEKEDLEERTEQTNLKWLKSSFGNCTSMAITDKLSIRKMMKRAHKNRALLTVQNKIFERRSIYLLKCHYKVKIGEEEKEAEIVFCEMPGSEKLTQNEKDSLTNMQLTNKLFLSQAEFTNFWIQSYPTRRQSMLMTILDPNFLRNCDMTVISHISLNRETFEETVTLFRFLKHFNETIDIQRHSKETISTNSELSELLNQFEKMRTILATHTDPDSVKSADALLKEIEGLQASILSKCLRLSPAQLELALQKIPELSNMAKILETKPVVIPKPKIENLRKNTPYSLCELTSITDSKRLSTNHVAKSFSSPIHFQETNGFKGKSKIAQDTLYKYIDEISETDLEMYKAKLGSEGRCQVCTLKNCGGHSKSELKGEKENTSLVLKAQERVIIGRRLNSRERQRPANASRPKENLYDPENVNPALGKGNMSLNNVENLTKRKFKRAGSLQCETVVARESNLDRSYNDLEVKSRVLVNQSVVDNMSIHDVENYLGSSEKVRGDEVSGPKLVKQLKLEEYHERKILDNIRNIKDKKMLEDLYKKETEMMEEKKRKYYDSQRKKLEEMRKIKTEEKRREREESEQREKEEAKKKRKTDQYYKKLKEKVFSYRQKRIVEIMLSAGNNTIQLEEEEEYEAVFEKDEPVKVQADEPVVNKVLSYPSSAQKTIREDILDLSKDNEVAEVLEEEILEESINA